MPPDEIPLDNGTLTVLLSNVEVLSMSHWRTGMDAATAPLLVRWSASPVGGGSSLLECTPLDAGEGELVRARKPRSACVSASSRDA